MQLSDLPVGPSHCVLCPDGGLGFTKMARRGFFQIIIFFFYVCIFFTCLGIVEPNNERVPNKNPLLMIEEEQKEQSAKLSKMEREMEEVNNFLIFYGVTSSL